MSPSPDIGADDLQTERDYWRTLIEVTGLVRRADLDPPRGIGIGNRVRIGGGQPQSPIGAGAPTSPAYAEAIIDVESWRPLPGDCPQR